MRRNFRVVFGAACAIACLGAAVFFWPERHAHGISTFVLVTLALTGIGTVISTSLTHSHQSTWLRLAPWMVFGALLAQMLIGIMWILYFYVPILVSSFCAAIVGSRWKQWAWLVNLGTVVVSFVLAFGILICLTTSIGVASVDAPIESVVLSEVADAYYQDAYRVEVSTESEYSIDSVARLFLVSREGIWTPHRHLDEIAEATFEPGSCVSKGTWIVFHHSENEIVIGINHELMTNRTSIFKERTDGHLAVTVSTAIVFHDWKGKLSFAPIRFIHQILLADTMRKLKTHLH